MKHYRGDRTIDGVAVTVDGAPLPERTDLLEVSRDGFEWSYEGHAPAQLAFAMLVDHFEDPAQAGRLYERFMREVVANFGNEWEYTSADIDLALSAVAA